MRLLAVADLHGSQYRLNIVLNNIERYHPDVVVVCGDITQFGPGKVATNFLNQIPVETLAIPGNIDSDDVGDAIRQSKAKNIDLQKITRNGVSFIGIGGMIRPPLFVSDGNQKKPIEEVVEKSSVVITHIPPYKLQDKAFIGNHAGSKDLRALIVRCTPHLVLCGHIHEDPGVTTFGYTTVVNCSLGKRTEGALIDLDEKLKVTILE